MGVSLLCILVFPSSSKHPWQVVINLTFDDALDVFCLSSFSNRIQHGATDVKDSVFFGIPWFVSGSFLFLLSFNGRACLNLNERLESPLSLSLVIPLFFHFFHSIFSDRFLILSHRGFLSLKMRVKSWGWSCLNECFFPASIFCTQICSLSF